jgi:hypothetical protein
VDHEGEQIIHKLDQFEKAKKSGIMTGTSQYMRGSSPFYWRGTGQSTCIGIEMWKSNFYPQNKIGSQKNRLEMRLREIESKYLFSFGGKSQISTFLSP